MRRFLIAAVLVLLSTSCRDEQAGPRNRPPPPPTPQQGQALDTAPPNLTGAVNTTMGNGAIVYLGSRVSTPKAKAGQPVSVAHYFKALKDPPQGFMFFEHIVDEGSGQMLVNADHDFQQGAMPLGKWPVGKVVEDVTTFNMPAAPSGQIRVLMGFWQGDSRLPVDNPASHRGDQRLLGPTIGIQTDELPVYQIHRTAKAPTIDGDLSDPVWQSATPVDLAGSYDGRKTVLRTTARMLWDDQNVYIAFDNQDPDVWGTLHNRDDAIYNEEVVEAFFDANGDQKTYNELEVSPHNTIFDAYFVSYRSDLEAAKPWDAQMKTAVKVNGTIDNPSDQDQGWTVEMAVPINRLAEVPHVPPQVGDKWRFNLYRLDHLGRKQVEGSAFSPLFRGDFHNVQRFGVLEFVN
ncbi:MAG: carbohydrate-binding family 9-like protein [Myxococcaceae bacterium]